MRKYIYIFLIFLDNLQEPGIFHYPACCQPIYLVNIHFFFPLSLEESHFTLVVNFIYSKGPLQRDKTLHYDQFYTHVIASRNIGAYVYMQGVRVGGSTLDDISVKKECVNS